MRERLFKWRQSPLVRSVAAVVGGNSLAQVVVLLFAPVITRIYSPDVFGIQGVFLAAISLLAPVAALRFPMAIVIARDPQEAQGIRGLSAVTAAFTSGVLLILLLAFREEISAALGIDELGSLVFLLPFALFLTALQESANYTAIRENRFRAISVTTALHSLVLNSARVGLGLFVPTAASLVSLSTVGPGVHALMLGNGRVSGKIDEIGVDHSQPSYRKLVRRYREFPVMRTPTDMLNSASQSAPVVLLGVLFSPAIAGWYTLARSVLNLPVNVIGGAMGNVLYAHFAQMRREREALFGLALKSTLMLLLGPGVLVIFASLLAPTVFALAFGEVWREAGVYARWMGLWTGVAIANIPGVKLAPVIGRQGALLVANALILVARLGAISIAYMWTHNPLTTVISYSVVSMVAELGIITMMLSLTVAHDKRAV